MRDEKVMKSVRYLLIGFLLVFILVSITSEYSQIHDANIIKDDDNKNLKERPETSAFIGNINLTNQEVNNTRHYHHSTLTIRGRIMVSLVPYEGANLTLKVNGAYKPSFTTISNSSGEFEIDYVIENSLNVFSSHLIQVNCTDYLGGALKILNHYIIYTNTTSFFQWNTAPSTPLNRPYLVGETIILNGYLRQDNGNGINGATVNKYLENGTHQWDLGSFLTIPDGGFPNDAIQNGFTIQDTDSSAMNIKLNYSGNSPYINQSEAILPSFGVFKNITCKWTIDAEAQEGDTITLTGQIFASNHPTMKINNRDASIYFNGEIVDTITTDSEGKFSVSYEVPTGTGERLIEIRVSNGIGAILESITTITILEANPPKKESVAEPPTTAPFVDFFTYFIPIIIGVAALLIFLGYRFLKKQEKESRVVELPLQNRLLNLKILKDSGRIEEALSYLFNAIYMDLVNAKYNRKRTPTETIRDFAIISVRELQLNPAIIYPFIQKIEETIYARPKTSDKDFYDAISLFSPVYFELTGYNFALNF